MIVNKCIRQNWKLFNQIRFQPIGFEVPKEDSQKWSEIRWDYICEADLKRHACYINKSKGNKYNITLWSDDEYLYLIQVIRTEYNSDSTLVYMVPFTEDTLNDFKAIAKFIHKNINDIINHSVNGVHELNRMAAANEIKGELYGDDA